MKVFLGGTCNGSTWRSAIINLLKIDYFNPVVDDWTPEHQAEELKQRQECDYLLYVITPRMSGVYSIAEVIDDSNKRPYKTLFCVLQTDVGVTPFSHGQEMSLRAVAGMVQRNGGMVFGSLLEIAEFLNSKYDMSGRWIDGK